MKKSPAIVRAALLVAALSAALSAAVGAATPAAHGAAANRVLPAALADVVASSGLSPGSFGLHAQEVVGERTLVSMNAERLYSMASTTKIVTSLAALDLLGPFYRWRTSAFALGPLADGRLAGDLLIVGGGNSQLTSAELQGWLRRMRDQGLREIEGNIVLDRSAFQLQAADHAQTPAQSADAPRHVCPTR